MFKIAFCLKKNFLLILLLIFPILLFGQNKNNQSKDSLFLNNSLKEIYKKQNPSSFIGSYTYNPELNLYIYNVKVGDIDIESPLVLTPDEFKRKMFLEESKKYIIKKQKALSGITDDNKLQKELLPNYYIKSDLFESIFGSNEINIKPQGSASIDLGIRYQKSGNPSLSPRNQSNLGFDFNQRINLSLTGDIGTRLRVNANYDTQSTFDFQQIIKLEFFPDDIVPNNKSNSLFGGSQGGFGLPESVGGNEDGILQKLEIGNVSMPINSSLITGAQSLFGVKADLKFGRTNISAVISEQKSQSQTIETNGEGILQKFSLFPLDYEENRHFFLSHYFRDNYDFSVSTYPYINSSVQITRVEVWITNRNSITDNVRNIVAIQDLGETNPENSSIDDFYNGFFVSNPNSYPSNSSNILNPSQIGTSGVLNNSIRDIASVKEGFGVLSSVVIEGRDYSVLESARKLNENEYKLNNQLGYISLRQSLNNDEVIAVAFQYTVNGKTYQVGEFSSDGVPATTVSNSSSDINSVNNNSLVLKMLKSSVLDVSQPVWNLMMKNIYNIGAIQLQQDDFVLNILYSDPSPTNFIKPENETSWPEGVENKILLNLFGLDKLNIYADIVSDGDGFFDFVSGITVLPEDGQIIFPSVEPFGKFLFDTLKSNNPQENYLDRNLYNENQSKYVFKEMYDRVKTDAENYQRYNKFEIKGKYKSSSSEQGISLGTFNIPRGSVKVTAGGQILTEGSDYTVNYQLGRVTIINESLKNLNIPIEVSTESNTLFGQQNKRFSGFTAEHKINDDLLIGGTYMRLSERPITQKSNYGSEPVNNTMIGFNAIFSKDIPFLTRMVNKLPNIDTQFASNISVRAEAAYLNVGTPKSNKLNDVATAYIDDFEGTQTNLDIRDTSSWTLSSIPATSNSIPLQGSGIENNDLSAGFNRAKLAWYNIDPIFYSRKRPSGISDNDLSTNETRRIFINEVFPQQDVVQGQSTIQYTLDLAYYPNEKGPYNNSANFGENPENNWAGITRAMTTTNFNQSSVEHIEFWVLDTFSENENNNDNLGNLVFHLGSISEDILKDGRKQFENGLPSSQQNSNVYSTAWGKTPASQSLVYAFDLNQQNRTNQDLGLDGLNDQEEKLIYTNGPINDPAGDNYTYFAQENGSILERYKNYNGTQGNSPIEVTEQFRGSYTYPDSEDINKDNTMNTIDKYFQYRIPISKNMQVGSHPFIVDVRQNQNIQLPNGDNINSRWLQFRIPVNPNHYDAPLFSNYFESINGMKDLSSVRFMRMMVTGFSQPVVFRFGTLDLVRSDWKRLDIPLNNQGINYTNTQLEITGVNILENDRRTPIQYKLPPGIERETLNTYNNLIRENEQSLSLKVIELESKDSQGVYKHIDLDMRQYKKIRMFIHAESIVGKTPLPGEGVDEELDSRISAFIRIGSDIDENYYQIEIPLKPTAYSRGISNNLSADEVWQVDDNEIDIPIEILTKLKAKSIANRNINGATFFDEDLNLIQEFDLNSSLPGEKKYKFSIKGNPSLGAIRTLVVGVKNPGVEPNQTLSGEVWFNELRLSEIDSKGGWAAVANIDASLADFAKISVNGAKTSVGFGSIDKSPNQRSQDDITSFAVSTSVNAGMLFPKKWGVIVPLSYSYNEETITPEYDPYFKDIKLKNRLDTSNRLSQRDSIKKQAISTTKLKSFNLIGLRKQRNPESNQDFFDLENFDFSYSFNQETRSDYEIEDYNFQNLRIGAGYNYSFESLSIKPLSKLKFISSKNYLKWLSELNFNLLPSSLSVTSNINRILQSQRFRQIYLEGVDYSNQISLPDLQQRNYLFDWLFTVNHNLTNSLRLDFSASSNNIVRNFNDDDLENSSKTEFDIWDGLWNTGEMNQFNQSIGLTYQIPFKFIPLLSFLNATYSYNGNFNWQRGSSSLKSVVDENNNSLGIVHTLQNANSSKFSGRANLQSLYNRVGLIKKKKSKNNIGTNILNSIIGAVTLLENIQFSYSETNGTVLPGYTQNIGFLGTSNPGISFSLGSQKDLRYEAAKKGWLTNFPNFNQPYSTVHNLDFNYNAEISLINGLKLDLSGNKIYSKNFSENFNVDMSGNYNSLSPRIFGNFEISSILLKTSFKSKGKNSENFNNLKDNRIIIAQRLAKLNNIPTSSIDEDGFPVGFGKNNQAVLVPSFLSAYTGVDPNKVQLGAMRSFPLPNWSLQYTGLMNLKSFKKIFNRFSLSHGYRASHTLNSFSTNLEYLPLKKDKSGNFMNEIIYSNINLVEQFNPLVKIDFVLKNSLQLSAEIRKDRALSLSLDNNLLTETTGNEFVLGTGYRFKKVKFKTNIGGRTTNLNGDINIKADLTMRNNITYVRNLDLLNNQVTAGQKLWSLKMSADYDLSRNFTALFFYDHTFSKFEISTSFPQTNIRSGLTLRYNFGN